MCLLNSYWNQPMCKIVLTKQHCRKKKHVALVMLTVSAGFILITINIYFVFPYFLP